MLKNVKNVKNFLNFNLSKIQAKNEIKKFCEYAPRTSIQIQLLLTRVGRQNLNWKIKYFWVSKN